MEILFMLPIAVMVGFGWLAAFFWSVRSGQMEDLEGAACRILFDEEDAARLVQEAAEKDNPTTEAATLSKAPRPPAEAGESPAA